MDTSVRLTLPKAGAFGENSLKNEGSLGKKPNFGSKLGALGENVTCDLSVSALKAGICKKKIFENGKNDQFIDEIETKSSFLTQANAKNRGLWMRAIEEPTFHQKMWVLWVTAETISKNMGSLGDSSAENRGSWEPYIRVISVMGVPPMVFFILDMTYFIVIQWMQGSHFHTLWSNEVWPYASLNHNEVCRNLYENASCTGLRNPYINLWQSQAEFFF